MIDPIALIQAAKARRAALGLVATSGIHCPTQAWVDYYNARDAEPKDAQGRILKTPRLIALKKSAMESSK
jgi:P pilus assembly chaperone PapD